MLIYFIGSIIVFILCLVVVQSKGDSPKFMNIVVISLLYPLVFISFLITIILKLIKEIKNIT